MLPELFTTLSGNGKKIFTVGEVQVLIQWWEIPAFMGTKAGCNIASWKPPCFIPGDKSYGTTLSVHQMFGYLSLLSVFLLKTVFRERSSLWMNWEMLLNQKEGWIPGSLWFQSPHWALGAFPSPGHWEQLVFHGFSLRLMNRKWNCSTSPHRDIWESLSSILAAAFLKWFAS